MANQFSTIQLNQGSEKFYLIRIVPRRYVNDDLAAIGGGQYQMTFPYFIQKVTANATELTKVTTIANPGEWSFNESTKSLTVYSTPSANNSIIVWYYIFYTGGRHRVVTEDPENSSTTLRDWLPRIKTNPSIQSSIEDVIVGNLKISISSLTIINDQDEFQDFLTDNDSFNKAEVKIWLCLDSTTNIQKIYDGKIRDLTVTDKNVNIIFEDPLSELLEPALLGDDSSEVYWSIGDFANMRRNDSGTPIRYIIGTASRYKTINDTAITGLANAQKLDENTLYNGICTTFSNTISTTTNREWGICRVSTDGFIDFGFTPSNIDNSAGGYTRLDGTAAQADKFRIGDTFVAAQGGTDYYLRAVYIDRTNNYVYTTKEAAISTGAVIEGNNCPSIVITNEIDQIYYALYDQDYTATVAATSGGNKYLKIDFVNNFEANHAGLTTLDPGVYQVRFRIRPDTTNAKHGSVISSLLTAAGLDINAASISSANSSLAVNCNFSIPQFDEEDFNNYVKYIELILKSALAYISLNNSFEIEYHLFSAPSSTDGLTDVDILKDSMSIELDYTDIIHQLIAFNSHWSSTEATEDTNDTPSHTEISNKSKYLHDINKVVRFRHVLESMNSRLPDIMKVRGNREALYNFSTKIINVDDIIGDDFLLSRDGILGGNATKQLKILGLSKSPKKTKIIASDLLDL